MLSGPSVTDNVTRLFSKCKFTLALNSPKLQISGNIDPAVNAIPLLYAG